jgi:hypothetical protein
VRFITPATTAVSQSSSQAAYGIFVSGMLTIGVEWLNTIPSTVVGLATISYTNSGSARSVNMLIKDALGNTVFDDVVVSSSSSAHEVSFAIPFYLNIGETIKIYETTATGTVSIVASFARGF